MARQNQKKRSQRVVIPRPDRMRRIGAWGFGWIDARILKDHWFVAMSPEEIAVYLFLCLVANQQGISWYRRDRIRDALNLQERQVSDALERLCELDLVAYLPFGRYETEGFRQVLSLPPGGPSCAADCLEALELPMGLRG